jgi:hypothetical protein
MEDRRPPLLDRATIALGPGHLDPDVLDVELPEESIDVADPGIGTTLWAMLAAAESDESRDRPNAGVRL